MDVSILIQNPILYNDFLLNQTNTKNFKEETIKNNINKIYQRLKNLNEKDEEDKYLSLSCIYGAFLGDSIGSCSEFKKKNSKNHESIFKLKKGIFEIGELTDDSEMAMSAAFAYLDIPFKESSTIQDFLFYYFCIWKNSHPKDIGVATQKSLSLFEPNVNTILNTKFNHTIKKNTEDINKNSLANGFLMRISPFIVYFYYAYYDLINEIFEEDMRSKRYIYLYYKIYDESYKNVIITHPNEENVVISAIFSFMVFTAMKKKKSKDVLDYLTTLINHKSFINRHVNKEVAKQALTKVLEVIKQVKEKKQFDVYSQMGYYLHAFKLTIYFLYKYPQMEKPEIYENQNCNNLYRTIMEEICDFGGDTDTNCAIVGTLIGPLIGYKKFDQNLFDIFIHFFPKTRLQYISAFMFEYVELLENKYLYNYDPFKEKNQEINEDSKDSQDFQIIEKMKYDKKKFHFMTYKVLIKFLNEQ